MQLLIHRASVLALLKDEQKFKLGRCWRPLFHILTINFSGINWVLHHVPYIFYLFLTSATSFGWVVVVGHYIPKMSQNWEKPRPAGLTKASWPSTSTTCATSSIQEWSKMLTLPLNRGLQVGLIKWTERPSTWIKGPTCSTYPDLLDRNHLSGVHTYVDKRSRWNGEPRHAEPRTTGLGEAGRPINFSFEPMQPSTII